MSWRADNERVRVSNRIYHNKYTNRGHAYRWSIIDRGEVIQILDHINVPFQNGLPRQRVDNRCFQFRQCEVHWDKTDSFCMYPNRPAQIDRVVVDLDPHISDRRVAQFIRCMLAERVREAARCFGIDISILQLFLVIPTPRFTVYLLIPTPP